MKKEFLEFLRSLNACEPAISWVREKGYSFEEAYQNCPKGEWLLWLFLKTSLNLETERCFYLTKGLCANTVRGKMKDKRSVEAVDAAIAFGNGEISEKQLTRAAVSAYYAYDTARCRASFAAFAAATSASPVAAASAAAAAAVAADYDYAREENELLTANICRKYLPIEIWKIKM